MRLNKPQTNWRCLLYIFKLQSPISKTDLTPHVFRQNLPSFPCQSEISSKMIVIYRKSNNNDKLPSQISNQPFLTRIIKK